MLDVQEYDLDTIFEKGLYFLLPFYIFRYEKEFGSISKDSEKLEELKLTYVDIEQRLEQVKLEGKIDEYTKRNIMEMSLHVLRKLAAGRDHIIEEVSSVMGGNVLQTEAHTILKQGALSTLASLVTKGLISIKDAAAELGVSETEFCQRMNAL